MTGLVLPPGEPEAGPWRTERPARLAHLLLAGSEGVGGRPWVVAVDGRGGAGKSTLARLLLPHLAPAAVVHTDDLAWHEPLFGWGHLLTAVLEPLRAGEPLRFSPPAWAEHGRPGALEVPAGLRVLLVEGTGAAQQAAADLVDRVVWVQADVVVAGTPVLDVAPDRVAVAPGPLRG